MSGPARRASDPSRQERVHVLRRLLKRAKMNERRYLRLGDVSSAVDMRSFRFALMAEIDDKDLERRSYQ